MRREADLANRPRHHALAAALTATDEDRAAPDKRLAKLRRAPSGDLRR